MAVFSCKIANPHHVLSESHAEKERLIQTVSKRTQQSENENVKTKKKRNQHRHHTTPYQSCALANSKLDHSYKPLFYPIANALMNL